MIETLQRSGLARTARLSVGDAMALTPNIAFVRMEEVTVPDYAELVLTAHPEKGVRMITRSDQPLLEHPSQIRLPLSMERRVSEISCYSKEEGAEVREQEVHPEGEVAVLHRAFEMRRDARTFVRKVNVLRETIGPMGAIYAPGIMDVPNLALLCYCGIDLFDDSLLLYEAAKGKLSLPEGTLQAEKAPWLLADASAEGCAAFNLRSAWNELMMVRHMIGEGRLRELVEIRSNANPWSVSVLRLLDLERYELQEKNAPVVGPRFYANSKQALFRPDIRRWRKRVLERFQPAEHKKVLLLIPCSAKKPYFLSRSHQLFRSAIQSIPNSEAVQELILTSPIGAVPRELELFYPAAQYDIPVTGHWDREEVAMVQELVTKVASLGFEKVICHLGDESEFVKQVVDCVDTTSGSPTSSESLRNLAMTLEKATSAYERVGRGLGRARSMAAAARFQFGPGGELLLDGCSVSGNYPYSKITENKVQLGLMTPERGMISLTLEGAAKLMPTRLHQVHMGDFQITGNLFAIGVVEADEGIRIGDEVIITRNGALEAVGIAGMSGPEMKRSKRGEAVRVRHKRRPGPVQSDF